MNEMIAMGMKFILAILILYLVYRLVVAFFGGV